MPITLNWSKAKSVSLTQQLRDVPLATWNCVQGLQGHHHQYLGIPQEPNLLQCHSLMVAMVVSLLVSSLPLLIAIGDVLVPFVLISSFTCIECYGLKEHLRWYAFKSSLIDIPLVSVVRSDCTFSHIPLVLLCPMTSLSVRSLIFRSWIVIFVSLVP